MISPQQAVFAAILACAIGAALTLPLARRQTWANLVAFLAVAVSAGLTGIAGWETLSGAEVPRSASRWLVAGADWQRLQVDGLSAIFLLLAAVVAVLASLYSLGYLRQDQGRGAARFQPHFLLFMAAVYGLLSTTDTMWWFLIFWQIMVFSGYELIRFDRAAGARGANRFAIMMELACAAILAATGLLAHGAGAGAPSAYQWHSLSANLPAMLTFAPADSALAFALLLLGFGIVMGVWPFGQMWLPQASPAAPAPVSALLCGVLIKLGVYGLLRYFLFLLPAGLLPAFPLATWGMVIAALGTITLFAGTMQALQQEQCKALLAFHSIGQMGYILLALGVCLALAARPGAAAAAIAGFALLAALFHLLNHSLFATLLYCNAGSVLHATGTQNLNRLGGLMRYMPLTGLTALVGALSISGVPLFNGFASKWAIFVAAIQGAPSARYLAVCAAIAILTSGLTLASFLKFFGGSFLSRTSELVKQKAGLIPAGHVAEARFHTGMARSLEVGWSMQLPQVLLAFACVLLGVFPALAIRFLQQALAAFPQGLAAVLAPATPVSAGGLAGVTSPQGVALFLPLPLLGVLAAAFLVAYGISRLGSSPRRAAAPWLCGYAPEAECHRYIAHNFYGEIKRRFFWLGGAQNGKAVTVKGRVL